MVVKNKELTYWHSQMNSKMSTIISVRAQPEHEASVEARIQPNRPPRILLVEDEKPIRDILVLILFQAGFDCREAADGRAAMDLLRSGTRINLVLSNMLLPKVDGWTLFLHVKQSYPKIPFVFVTAIDDSGVREVAAREGAAGYLLKPFEREEFLTTVREALYFTSTCR
jgi:CheY-like chemotaxis protein